MTVFTEEVVTRLARLAVRIDPNKSNAPVGESPLVGKEVALATALRFAEEAHNGVNSRFALWERNLLLYKKLEEAASAALQCWRALDQEARAEFALNARDHGNVLWTADVPLLTGQPPSEFADQISPIVAQYDRAFALGFRTARSTWRTARPDPGRPGKLHGLVALGEILKAFWENETSTPFGQEFLLLGDDKVPDPVEHLVPVSAPSRLFYNAAIQLDPTYTPSSCREVMVQLQRDSGPAHFGKQRPK